MRDVRLAWARVGDAVWNRFRALGVPDPAGATRRWLESEERAWTEGPVDATRLMRDATRDALRMPLGAPAPSAVAAFCCNARQLARVLAAPADVRAALVHAAMDGLALDEVAALLGQTATSVQLALNAVDDELASLADPLPPDMLPDGHLSTVQLHAYAAELLPPLLAQQAENHLGACAWCLARFTAWGEAKLAFDALPPPPAPRRRSPLIPLVGGGALLLGAGSVAAVAVLWRVERVEQEIEASTWKGEPPVVELRAGGRALGPDEVPPAGSLVEVWVDARHADQLAVARQVGDAIELVLAAPAGGPGLQRAPVELLVDGHSDAWLHVVTADHALDVQAVAGAVVSGAPGTAATSVALSGSPP